MNYEKDDNMWEYRIAGIELYYIINWFIIYSILGWIWETCYMSIKEKRLVNRGYVVGPVCTIYGVGAVSLYLLFRPISSDYFVLFFGGAIIATVIEYITAVLMEYIFHTSWWDYTEQKFNYKGRICLSSTIAWGAGSVILFTLLQPLVEKIVSLYSVKAGIIGISIGIILYFVDFTFATVAAFDLSSKLQKMDALLEEVSEYLKETRLYTSTEELRIKIEKFGKRYRGSNYISKFSKRREIRQAVFSEQLAELGLTGLRDDIKDGLFGFMNRLNGIVDRYKFRQNRIMNAYPNIKLKINKNVVHSETNKIINVEKKCDNKNKDNKDYDNKDREE